MRVSLEILIILSYRVILAGKPAKKKQRRLAETVEKAKEKEKEEKAEKKKDKEKEKEKEKEKDKGKERDKAGVSAKVVGKVGKILGCQIFFLSCDFPAESQGCELFSRNSVRLVGRIV